MTFEHKTKKLAPVSVFLRRVLVHVGFALLLCAAALSIGVAGYHWIAGLPLIDSLLNASMILGGMGPVDTLPNDGAKIFASLYALFSGLVFIFAMGIVLTPLAHRVMHQLHVDEE